MTLRKVCVSNHVIENPMISAEFVQKACEFQSNISVEIDNKRFINGKSLMGMLSLDLNPGMNVHISADGVDEAVASEVLGKLLGELV